MEHANRMFRNIKEHDYCDVLESRRVFDSATVQTPASVIVLGSQKKKTKHGLLSFGIHRRL